MRLAQEGAKVIVNSGAQGMDWTINKFVDKEARY
jgi:hypothetical protein